jgi:glycosyltransferase 2 family protein
MTMQLPGQITTSGEQQLEETQFIAPNRQRWGLLGKKTPKKKWVNLVFRLGVTILLFAFLLKSFSWSTLWVTMMHVHRTMLLLGLTVGAYGLVVSSYQWQSLLRAERIHVDLTRLINLYLVGMAFSHFLPTSMGGDVVKSLYVGRESGNHGGSASAIIMSRITGFFGMLLVAFPVMMIWRAHFTRAIVIWFVLLSLLMAGLIGGTIFCATVLPRFWKGRWAKYRIFASAIHIGNTLSKSAKRPRSICVATLFGVLFHIVACLNYYSYALVLRLDVPFYFYLVAVPFVSLVAFFPISINGFGVRESVFVYIFSTIQVPISTSLLLVFLMDVQVLIFGAIGGCIYLAMGADVKITKRRSMTRKRHF